MAYGIMRVEKIKLSAGGELYGRAMHNLRQFKNQKEMFEPEKTRQNEYIGARTYQEFRRLANERWGTLSEGTRSDAVGMLEVIFTTSEGGIPKEKEKEFFSDCLKEVQSWYGAENVLAMQIHRDETTPHCHIFLTPIETVQKKKNRLTEAEKQLSSDSPELYRVKTQLNAKRLLNGRKSLSELQTKVWEKVFQKYDLERGVVGSTKKNVRSDISKKLEQAEEKLERAERTEKRAEQYAERTEKKADEYSEEVRAAAKKDLEKALKEYAAAQKEREEAKKERSEVLEDVVQEFANITKLGAVPPKPKFFESKRHYWAHVAVPYYAKVVGQWRLQAKKADEQLKENYELRDKANSRIAGLKQEIDSAERQNAELKQYDVRKKSTAELLSEAEKRAMRHRDRGRDRER